MTTKTTADMKKGRSSVMGKPVSERSLDHRRQGSENPQPETCEPYLDVPTGAGKSVSLPRLAWVDAMQSGELSEEYKRKHWLSDKTAANVRELLTRLQS